MRGPGLATTRSAGLTTRSAKPTIAPTTPSSARLRTVEASHPDPTATRRDQSGNPRNRDEYAARLRAQLGQPGRPMRQPPLLTVAQADVVARLLDELAGIYARRGAGHSARELSMLLDSQIGEQD